MLEVAYDERSLRLVGDMGSAIGASQGWSAGTEGYPELN